MFLNDEIDKNFERRLTIILCTLSSIYYTDSYHYYIYRAIIEEYDLLTSRKLLFIATISLIIHKRFSSGLHASKVLNNFSLFLFYFICTGSFKTTPTDL